MGVRRTPAPPTASRWPASHRPPPRPQGPPLRVPGRDSVAPAAVQLPPWQTVYQVFRTGTLDPTWAALNAARHLCPRREEGRRDQPRAAVLDRQSVQSDGPGGAVGYDAGKRIKGRKRHLLVDPLGLLLGVAVTPASCPEREGAQTVPSRVADWFPRLRRLWVDGYTGEAFGHWVKEHWPKLKVEVVKRSDEIHGCVVLPRRWVVERTFGWLMRHRRLVRDYERTVSSAEAWIHLAMIRIQLRRLA